MKLLHIDSSVLGGNSVSRQITAAAVARLKAQTPGLEVTYLDLAATPLLHLSGAHLAAAAGAAPEVAEVAADVTASSTALDSFLAADILVIGAPMYNFTIPSQLKAWIDRILVAGKTFKYGANGPEGLATGKRAILVLSRGGKYGAGSPAAGMEHAESFLRGALGFIGVTNVETIIAEGVAMGPEARTAALTAATEAAGQLAA